MVSILMSIMLCLSIFSFTYHSSQVYCESLQADYPFTFYPSDCNKTRALDQQHTHLECYLGPLYHYLESTLRSIPFCLRDILATHASSLMDLDD
ncbi:hypothetical protein IFR05_017607, partial [Cadophora sp. M221]